LIVYKKFYRRHNKRAANNRVGKTILWYGKAISLGKQSVEPVKQDLLSKLLIRCCSC